MTKSKASQAGELGDMNNPERLKYFKVVDQLRGFGVNEDLPLPQIVVVGDQSSGKSSLLEGLTSLSFPVAADLCTRFATQIVMRRTPCEEAVVKVSIMPGPSSMDNEKERERLLSFSINFKKSDFSETKFAWMLDEAAECMGLPTSDDQDLENLVKRFSDDILRIELSGPDEHHLSVVDVPGLFHNPTKYQTKEDLAIIRALIEGYTTDSRTIILAVMDARNNLANQEVFKLARAADPEGNRTVGIITKCDALQKGEEVGVLKIAQNTVEHLQHGWFAVRNRSAEEIRSGVTIAQRHENEKKFFQTTPWNELSKERIGIRALKPFLGQLLYEHIRREFPSLVKEIEQLYNDTQKRLESLGSCRQTATEQRQYLIGLATKYQQNVVDALVGNYDASLDAKSNLKLRMHLRAAAEAFAEELRKEGHTLPFKNVDGSTDQASERDETPEDINEWIRTVYLDSRGSELPGTVNPAVMQTLFRQQSIRWEAIAARYIKTAEDIIRAYNSQECERIELDDKIRRLIEKMLDERTETAASEAGDQLQELLKDERAGILQTVNHYFAQNLRKIREDRVIAKLKALGFADGHNYEVSMQTMVHAAQTGNDEQAINDIHDVLKAYYKVALKRFMDNVLVSVVERKLLGHGGPVRLFDASFVACMSDTQLAAIAAESYTTSTIRVEVSQKALRLRQALEVAKTV